MKNRKFSLLHALPQMIIDILCVFASYYFAYMMRFDGKLYEHPVDVLSFQTWIPWITLVCIAVFFLFRFYSTMWQFASLDELLQIFYGTTLSGLLVTFLGFTLSGPVFPVSRFPKSVYVLGWIFMLFLIGAFRFGFRFVRRLRRKSQADHRHSDEFHRVMTVSYTHLVRGLLPGQL